MEKWNMSIEWFCVSASRDDEDMPLMKDTLGHWSTTQIIKEGTGWEHRASIVSLNTYMGK